MKRLHISSLIVIGAVTTLLSSGAPAAPSPDAVPSAPSKEFACSKDKTCPLLVWMKANMGPTATEDPPPWDTLAKNFKIIAGKGPSASDYPNWSKFASDGAAAAGKKDLAGVKGACKNCHDTYKKKFKEETRDHPFP